jgi:hypothetical protein
MTDKVLGILFAFSALILTIVFLFTKKFYFAFLAGFAIGLLSFKILALTASASDRYSNWLKALIIFSTPFKLIGIGLVIYLLKLAGLSVIQLLTGLLASQPAILSSLVLIVYLQRKNVENTNIGPEK